MESSRAAQPRGDPLLTNWIASARPRLATTLQLSFLLL
jgi:hypothetical protein